MTNVFVPSGDRL